MDSLYIVVPAYNESDNIEQFVNDWYPVVEAHSGDGKSRLVIINDGSKDDTYEKLLSLAETRPYLVPLTKPNGGHGPTLIYGYRYAIEHGADYIFQTDSDGQTVPSEFENFWEKRETLCFLLRVIFRVALPDANAPYRLMKRELLEKYVGRFEDDYNLPNVMLTTFFACYHEKMIFLPITFLPRQHGTNSINVKNIVKIGWNSLSDFNRFRREIDRDRRNR